MNLSSDCMCKNYLQIKQRQMINLTRFDVTTEINDSEREREKNCSKRRLVYTCTCTYVYIVCMCCQWKRRIYSRHNDRRSRTDRKTMRFAIQTYFEHSEIKRCEQRRAKRIETNKKCLILCMCVCVHNKLCVCIYICISWFINIQTKL